MDYSKFDSMVDLNGLKKDVRDSEEKSKDFDDVPHGSYEVKVDKMELTESKNGDPMVSIWFKILEGKHKERLIFMNQVITRGFQVHLMNQFLKSFDTDANVYFETYSQYAKLIEYIKDYVGMNDLNFELEYGEKKGYNTFKIVNVFEPADDTVPF